MARSNKATPVIVLAALVSTAAADRVDLLIHENADNAQASLEIWIDVSADATDLEFVVHNDSGQDPVLTAFYLEQNPILGNVSNGSFMGGSNDVDFVNGSSPANPAALGSSGFWGDPWAGTGASFGATPSRIAHGIAVTENATFQFDNDLALTTADLVGMINDGSFRLAAHVQRVGIDGGSSVWVVTPAPPAAALLGVAGLFAGRRR